MSLEGHVVCPIKNGTVHWNLITVLLNGSLKRFMISPIIRSYRVINKAPITASYYKVPLVVLNNGERPDYKVPF